MKETLIAFIADEVAARERLIANLPYFSCGVATNRCTAREITHSCDWCRGLADSEAAIKLADARLVAAMALLSALDR